jgi:hypothetical protein
MVDSGTLLSQVREVLRTNTPSYFKDGDYLYELDTLLGEYHKTHVRLARTRKDNVSGWVVYPGTFHPSKDGVRAIRLAVENFDVAYDEASRLNRESIGAQSV